MPQSGSGGLKVIKPFFFFFNVITMIFYYYSTSEVLTTGLSKARVDVLSQSTKDLCVSYFSLATECAVHLA